IRYEASPGIADLFGDAIEADADPWETAKRKRAQGQRGAAIVALFAHMLMLLEKTEIIRIAPGRTPRQLVRSIADPLRRSRSQPALGLFEASVFGHHEPSTDDFEFAWSEAVALRDDLLSAAREEDARS